MPSPLQLRQQEQRERKLADIREQVTEGTLVIRKMTAKERKLNPPTPRSSRRASRPRG
jgi:hypothetical protein